MCKPQKQHVIPIICKHGESTLIIKYFVAIMKNARYHSRGGMCIMCASSDTVYRTCDVDFTILQPRPTYLENLLIVIHLIIIKQTISQRTIRLQDGRSFVPTINKTNNNTCTHCSGGYRNIWYMYLVYSVESTRPSTVNKMASP